VEGIHPRYVCIPIPVVVGIEHSTSRGPLRSGVHTVSGVHPLMRYTILLVVCASVPTG
jgi:hypothetical protein